MLGKINGIVAMVRVTAFEIGLSLISAIGPNNDEASGKIVVFSTDWTLALLRENDDPLFMVQRVHNSDRKDVFLAMVNAGRD